MYAYFDVPGGFTAIPVGMSAEAAYDYARDSLRAAGNEDTEAGRRIVSEVHGISHVLRGIGALYAGTTIRLIRGEPSVAMLLVTTQEFAYGDNPRVAAEGAMHAVVAARGQAWTGKVYELPCGPAAVVVGGQAYPLPVQERTPGGANTPTHLPFAELQAFVPVPGHLTSPRKYLLTASFSTPSLGHWDAYMEPLIKLLRSVEFTSRKAAA
jgi:hypothetical protein